MSCPVCGLRFIFKDPFGFYDRMKCPKCNEESDIPEAIIEEFVNNMEFKDYIDGRRRSSQPPII